MILDTSGMSSDEKLWAYNCLDCVMTRECGEVEAANLAQMGLIEQDAFQQRMFWPVLEAMKRGVRIDAKRKDAFANLLMAEMTKREEYFLFILGHTLNPRSPVQMQRLFYDDLKQQPIRKRGTGGFPGGLTLDDTALRTIVKREPLLRPLVRAIAEYRTLGVFLKTFVLAQLDVDGRMRTAYNIAGTETFRFSSAENAFGSGTNLQNVPKGGEEDAEDELGQLTLPNVRTLFVPDPGFTMFDTDLSKADLRIVAWESNDSELKSMLKEGRDPYVETAREYYRDPSIVKYRADGTEHPKYDQFKRFSHGTNYLGTPHGLASRIRGLSVHEAERAQKWYFGKYPSIQKWHARVIDQLKTKHYVENIWGYRRHYFDRIDDSLFRQAIAWIPQSTVALLINKIWLRVWDTSRHIWVLLQVHDSLVGQFPSHRFDECLAQLRAAATFEIPYPGDPLVIPVGIKTSNQSWGDCV